MVSSVRVSPSAVRIPLAVSLLLLLLPRLALSLEGTTAPPDRPSWCGKLDTKGFTVPTGDILIRAGHSLNITCNLYESCVKEYNLTSSQLYFERDGMIIPSEMVEVINSTSIRLYVENVNVTKNDNYYCLFNSSNSSKKKSNEFICMNTVVVGLPPQEVTDFSCISRNFENMTCSWTPPNNYIITNYTLSYSLATNNNRKRRMLIYSCKHLEIDTKMYCFWNLSTYPHYRKMYSTFYFVLDMTNALGNRVLNYTFEHDKHVLPNPPVNLTGIATSPSTIELYWEIPHVLQFFKPGLTHRVLYHCEFEGGSTWTLAGVKKTRYKDKDVRFNLTGLRYPHAMCNIRVSSRSSVADEHDESMWSGNATSMVRTLNREPDRPPDTTPGSFEIVNMQPPRKVYIYWKQIEEYEQNGQDFRYVVEAENDPSLIPIEKTSSYVKFENLREEDYVFNVWSENEVGRSHRKSVVLVPRHPLTSPDHFVNAAYSDHLFQLSWKPPTDGSEIVNYTVFWCNSDSYRPYQCSGKLDWYTVPGYQNVYNKTLPSTRYQFAIAANSLYSSSGMSWVDCTVLVSTDQLLRNVWINDNGPDFIEIKWDLKCPGMVNPSEGFLISYCPVNALPKTSECIGEMKNQTIASKNPSTQSGRITGLKPSTTYLLQVRVKYSNNTYSKAVQTMRNITRETAPTPPRDLLVTEVTSNSVSLKWTPPQEMNGALKYYNIYYNDRVLNTTEDKVDLTNLTSFMEYNLIVEACTIACTNMSGYRSVKTKISMPSQIKKPILDEESNSSIAVIKWDQPENPNGNLNYYQLKLMESLADMNSTNKVIVNVTNALRYSVSCDLSPSYVSVRAVNIDENGRHMFGDWSPAMKVFPCTQATKMFLIILIVSLIVFGVLLVFGLRRVFTCLNTCRDVGVKLPPGLETDLWLPDRTGGGVTDKNSGADMLLLQDKSSETLESGISSGQESITSSEKSGGTHLTASDSGNEQPRSLPVEDTRKNSLRQRNVSSKGGYVLAEDVPTRWKAKQAPTAPGSYCVLGVAPPKQPDASDKPSDLSAVVTPTTDLPSSQPYVMAGGDFHKTLNPGYVPFEVCKPAEKNTGYVMAGVSDSLQYSPPAKQLAEEKPLYVRAGDNLKPPLGVQVLPWMKQQQQQQLPLAESGTLTKSGYVSVGSALPPAKGPSEVSKGGYVPHQQFEAKSLKED